MTSPLFKRAFVRGLNAELIRSGAVGFATKEAADYIADYIADNSGMPDPQTEGDKLTKEASFELCNALIDACNELRKQTGDYSDAFNKTAAAANPVEVANHDAWQIMEKCAAETGSLIQGGDKPNDQPAAAQNNAEASLEANRRPENYANLGERGVGNYERKGQGNVGTEEKHPEAPRATDAGGNSATENSKHANQLPPGMGGGMPTEGEEASEGDIDPSILKGIEIGLRMAAENPEEAAQLLAAHDEAAGIGHPAADDSASAPPMAHHQAPPPAPGGNAGAPEPKQASFEDIVKKIAGNTGSLIQGGDAANSLPAAAAHNAEAAHELKLRPENYANMGERGVGNTAFKAPASAIVGSEQRHPLAPKATDGGSNSVTEFGHKSAFDQLFEQTATAIVPYLPQGMDDAAKVAHVRTTMGLTTTEQGTYLQELYTSLGAEKTAAESVKTHFLKTAENKPTVCSTCHKEKCGCATAKQASAKSLSNLKLALSRLQQTS